MKTVPLFLLAIMIISGLQSCEESRLHKRYSTYYYETLWTYNFNLNGSFDVSASGHIGNVGESGKYAIRDGTIALFYNEESSLENNFENRFYIRSSEELVDQEGRHYWTDLDEKYEDWQVIETRDDQIKTYLEQHEDYKSYFSMMRLDTMKHINIIVNGVLKSHKKVLDVHYVSYSHPDFRREIAPYPLKRYVDPATGEVFLKNDKDELILDTILVFQ